jgi:hypothetical protein
MKKHLISAAIVLAFGVPAAHAEPVTYAKVGAWTISYEADNQTCSAGTTYGNKILTIFKAKGAVAPEAILIGGEGVNGLAADHDFPVFAKFNNGTSAPVRTSGTVKVLDQDKLIRFTMDSTFLQNFMLSANMELYAESNAGPRLLLMGTLEGTLEAMKKQDACETAHGLKNTAPPAGPITRGAPADPGGALPPTAAAKPNQTTGPSAPAGDSAMKNMATFVGRCRFQIVSGFFDCDPNTFYAQLSNGRSMVVFKAGDAMFTLSGGGGPPPNHQKKKKNKKRERMDGSGR